MTPCAPDVAQKHTGYLVGGTSPFGTRKAMPVFLERTIADLDRIYVNGGRRGFLIALAPADLIRTLSPTLVDAALDAYTPSRSSSRFSSSKRSASRLIHRPNFTSPIDPEQREERQPAPGESFLARRDRPRARIQPVPDPDREEDHLSHKHQPADATGHPHPPQPFGRDGDVVGNRRGRRSQHTTPVPPPEHDGRDRDRRQRHHGEPLDVAPGGDAEIEEHRQREAANHEVGHGKRPEQSGSPTDVVPNLLGRFSVVTARPANPPPMPSGPDRVRSS